VACPRMIRIWSASRHPGATPRCRSRSTGKADRLIGVRSRGTESGDSDSRHGTRTFVYPESLTGQSVSLRLARFFLPERAVSPASRRALLGPRVADPPLSSPGPFFRRALVGPIPSGQLFQVIPGFQEFVQARLWRTRFRLPVIAPGRMDSSTRPWCA
jgi:hypothetical protein